MIGSYPRHQRNGLAGPPMPSPLRIARTAPMPPAMHALTPLPLTSAKSDSRTQPGNFQESSTSSSHASPMRSKALLWSASTTAGHRSMLRLLWLAQKASTALAASPS
eukprot:3463268-Heterocapsa_arctica.AAC.1